jgi:hypothetical protein
VTDGTVVRHPRLFLRLEGLAAFALSVMAYATAGSSWLVFLLVFLAPDVSMLGYLAGPRVGAATYNIVHTHVAPAVLLALYFAGATALLTPCLIWSAHIGFDRLLGYGLKYPDTFGHTHLGRIGRRSTTDDLPG